MTKVIYKRGYLMESLLTVSDKSVVGHHGREPGSRQT